MLKQHRWLIPGIICVVILFAVLGGWWLSLPQGDELPASVQITASETEPSGISIDAAFQILTGFSVHEAQLRNLLEVEPALHYTLTGSGKEWTLTPSLPLKENEVYTIRVKSKDGTAIQSYAFQTRSDLLINQVFPSDGESYLDVTTAIEVRFNRPDIDLSAGFEILPAVSGRFQTSGYTSRFIPDKPLDYNSVYRVTLTGLKSPDGAALTEPYAFSFETREKEGEETWDDLHVDGGDMTYLPGDEMRVPLYGGEAQAKATYTLTLHKYPGINAYANVIRERDSYYRNLYGEKKPYRIETEGLDEIMNAEGALMEDDGLYAPLPDDLSEGYYVFTLAGTVGEKEQFVQQMIQVVNLSAYMQSSGGRALFWLNDPSTGGPVKATVELEIPDGEAVTALSTETDGNGLAHIETGDAKEAYVTVIREGTPVWFSYITLSPPKEEKDGAKELSKDFYAASYTDRTVYHPGDPIHFWGVVKPRANAPAPEQVRAELCSIWPEGTVASIDIPVRPDGTYEGVLSPSIVKAGGKSGSYNLEIKDQEGNAYLRSYISIENYTKPAYVLNLSTDKEWYYYGDTVQFQVEASYYDGTPAAGIRLLVDCYTANLDSKEVVLDGSGRAAVTGVLDPLTMHNQPGTVSRWTPQWCGWNVRTGDEQDLNLYESGSFNVLPSKIAAQLKYEGNGVASIQSAVLDESKITMEHGVQPRFRFDENSNFEWYRGVPADIPMSLVVHKTVWREIQTGNYYDPVNKKSVPVYETTSERTVDRTIPVTPVAGKATVRELPVAEDDSVSYSFELRFAGGVCGDVCETAQAGSPYHWNREPRYSFTSDEVYRLPMKPGENTKIALYRNGEKVPNTGKALYTLTQDFTVAAELFTTNEAEIPVKPEYMPNVVLSGAYFDGRNVYPIETSNMVYDFSEKTLNIEAIPDKAEYRPGDEMKVTLHITGPDGESVTGRAAVGVVDESVFAVSYQSMDFAEQIYQRVYYPRIANFATGRPGGSSGPAPMNTGGGERSAAESGVADTAFKTGGGDVQIRKTFADTAAFQVADFRDGVGEVTLTLPDNVTSWRITVAAVTEDLQAGDVVTNSKATLPFYVMPIVSKSYVVGDDVAVSALAVGTSLTDLAEDTSISYKAVLTQDGKELKTLTASAPVHTRGVFQLGKLEEGSYKVELQGGYQDFSDGMEVPFTVTKSGIVVSQLATMDLSELANAQSVQWPISLAVFDAAQRPMFDTLASLSSQDGQRTEIIAAAARARELYRELAPSDSQEPLSRDPRLDRIANEDGGIRPLPSAASDPALTAKFLLAAPELINSTEAVDYLRSALQNPSVPQTDRLMAYVGLAAAKEPVLRDLQRVYEENREGMPLSIQLYFGAAFARMGDYSIAKDIYASARFTQTNGYSYVDSGKDAVPDTAAALLLATEMSLDDDAAQLAQFLLSGYENHGDAVSGKGDVLANLELIAFASHIKSQDTAEGKFVYTDNGKTREVSLKDGVASLTLTEDMARHGNFHALSGRLNAIAQVYRSGNDMPADGNFATVTKTYAPIMDNTGPGGLVKVTVNIDFASDAPQGMYRFHDAIPSGLRWVSGSDRVLTAQNSSHWAYLSQDGQQLEGTVYYNPLTAEFPDGAEPVPYAHLPANTKTVQEAPEAVQVDEAEEAEEAEEVAEVDEAAEASSTTSEAETPVAVSDTVAREPVASNAYEVPVDVPVPDTSMERDSQIPASKSQVVITYYVSAALPGSFITESAWLSYEDAAVKSDRGVYTVD